MAGNRDSEVSLFLLQNLAEGVSQSTLDVVNERVIDRVDVVPRESFRQREEIRVELIDEMQFQRHFRMKKCK